MITGKCGIGNGYWRMSVTSLLYNRRNMVLFKQLHQLSEYKLSYWATTGHFDVSLHDKNISVWFTVSSRQNVRPLFFTKTMTSEVYATELLQPLIVQLTENEILRFAARWRNDAYFIFVSGLCIVGQKKKGGGGGHSY